MPWGSSSVRGGRNKVAYVYMYLCAGESHFGELKMAAPPEDMDISGKMGGLNQSHLLHMR